MATEIQFKRLDHLLMGIPIGQTAAARRFYADVLGLAEIPGGHPSGAI